ncbi:MAG: hypothetical protein CYPHOPRED_000382 [Cyphobasidiales sp. Tagirdzhanova-0007]|nr:MAG: hypothetical protein CYPHOPRED_000382 [Cyphobasidiales sp. Tagirdzhanova-0007]
MPSLAAIRAGSTPYLPLVQPTIVCLGGTSGIGAAIARRFAQLAQAPTVLLVGRNAASAQAVLGDLKLANPKGTYDFLPCDLTLLSDIRSLVASLLASSSSVGKQQIDYLVLSQGVLTMAGRTETKEGHDRKLMLHYYSRVAVLRGLESKLAPGARVMFVLDGTSGSNPKRLYWDDLDLRSNYSTRSAANHAITMTDLALQHVGAQHPQMAFFHALPGIVDTPIFNGLPWPVRTAAWPIGKLLSTSPSDCAEHLLHALLSADVGRYKVGHAYFCDGKGEPVKGKTEAEREEVAKVWTHTVGLLGEV